jgi:hypothetical protein
MFGLIFNPSNNLGGVAYKCCHFHFARGGAAADTYIICLQSWGRSGVSSKDATLQGVLSDILWSEILACVPF